MHVQHQCVAHPAQKWPVNLTLRSLNATNLLSLSATRQGMAENLLT